MDSQSAKKTFWQSRNPNHHRIDWRNKHRFILKKLRQQLTHTLLSQEISEDATIIDFGCGTQPYKDLIRPDSNYLAADLPGNPDAQLIINPLGKVETPDAKADFLLSTQVLEHVESPSEYLQECYRLLKPGGKLLLTTHGFWVYHLDPVDYWRWTLDGLVLEIERAGLKIEHKEGIGGLAAVAIQFWQDATLHRFPRVLRSTVSAILQSFIFLADRMHSPEGKKKNAMVYLVVATKPEQKIIQQN